ncbi:MAG: class I SAM-dependent RNA methyltransferase, partial [Acidobacteriota bacterium]
MSRSRPQRGEEHEVEIHDLAFGGNGVGRLASTEGQGGMVVFVPRAAPGDRLRVRLDRVKKRHAEGSLVAVEEPGPGRIEPPCPHYEEGCGGCTWQHLGYDAQLAAKEKIVRDSLERIGGFDDPPVEPILAAEREWFYRNKMEFSFHHRDGLGLHALGDWRRVVPVAECRLASD